MTNTGRCPGYGDGEVLRHFHEETIWMTEMRDAADVSEALSVIDKALAEMLHRELVSSGEVADLLLDVRMLLTATPVAAAAPQG
jgi:hypothetical protein